MHTPPTDAIQAVSHPDPYPWYRQQREGPPITFDATLGLWVATRAEVVFEALDHPALRVRPPAEPVPAPLLGRPVGEWFGRLVRMNDGERAHARPKAGLAQALAAVHPADTARRAREASERAPADWNTWMTEVPLHTVAGLLGFAETDLPRVATAVVGLVAAMSPQATASHRDEGDAAARQLLARLAPLLAAAVPDSLVARAARAAWPSPEALLANLAGLLTQTCEATAALLGNTVVALARGERAEPGALPGFVAEVMRHDAPVQNTRRFAAEPLSLAGTALPAGATVLLVLGSAGRDAALHAEEPERFMAARTHRRLPGFGWGPHACPGAALARHIAAAAVEQRLHAGHALPREWHYRPSVNARLPRFATHRKEPT